MSKKGLISFLSAGSIPLTKENYADLFTKICQNCGLADRHSSFWLTASSTNEVGKALIQAHEEGIPHQVVFKFIKEDLEYVYQNRIENESPIHLMDKLLIDELKEFLIITPTYQNRLKAEEINNQDKINDLQDIWIWYQINAMNIEPNHPMPEL